MDLSSRHLRRELSRQAVVAVAYLIAAWACLALPVREGPLTPVWIPAGLVLAAALVWGRQMLVAVFLADLGLNLVHNDFSTPVAVAISAGDVLDPLLALLLLGGMGFRMELDRARDVFALVVAGIAGAFVSA